MGASRRRIDRRLSRAVIPLPPVATSDRRWLAPAISLAYMGALTLALLSGDQLSQNLPGSWFDLLGISVLVLALLTITLLLRRAWYRQREQVRPSAVLNLGGALGATLVGVVAVIGLIGNAQVTSIFSGADVHLTRPVLDALPLPPGTKVLDETPGIQGTESISEDLSPPNLSQVVPFYERELTKRGWVEDKASASLQIVRFTRGNFILSVATDPPSGDYTITLDRVPATPPASASPPSQEPSATPGAS